MRLFLLITAILVFSSLFTTFAQFQFPPTIELSLPEPQFKGPDRVFCPLKWVPGSNGESPDEYVVAFNTDEIVARLDISGNFIVGRLSPEDGLAFASNPSDGSVHSSSNYEVLTNPSRCVVDWINAIDGNLPDYFLNVEVDVDHEGSGIGKSYFVGDDGNIHNVGGSVLKREGLFVSFQGRQENAKEYQVLTSTYPLLQGVLYNFTILDESTLQPNWIQVIQSETIRKAGGGFEQSQEIHHCGSVEEIFQLSESRLEWKGIQSISAKFSTSLGNFQTNFTTIQDNQNFHIGIHQNRAVDFKVNVKMSQEDSRSIQVCSVVQMMVEKELQFVASARFFGLNGMMGDEVKNILEASGRTVVRTNGNEAIAEIHGTLIGKFVVEKSSATSIIEHVIPCQNMFNITK